MLRNSIQLFKFNNPPEEIPLSLHRVCKSQNNILNIDVYNLSPLDISEMCPSTAWHSVSLGVNAK